MIARMQFCVLATGLMLAAAASALAQGADNRQPTYEVAPSEPDYPMADYAPPIPYESHGRAAIHRAAQQRAHQRRARLETVRSFQMSSGRPTANPLSYGMASYILPVTWLPPFTQVNVVGDGNNYSPVSQTAGDRRFYWRRAR